MSIKSEWNPFHDHRLWQEQTAAIRPETAVVVGDPISVSEIISKNRLPIIITDWGTDSQPQPMVELQILGSNPSAALYTLSSQGHDGVGAPGNGIRESSMHELIRQAMEKNRNLQTRSPKQYAVTPFDFTETGAVYPIIVNVDTRHEQRGFSNAICMHENDLTVKELAWKNLLAIRSAAASGDVSANEAMDVLYGPENGRMNALGIQLLRQLGDDTVLGFSSEVPNAALLGSELHMIVPQRTQADQAIYNTQIFFGALGYTDVSDMFHKAHFEKGNIAKKIVIATMMERAGNIQLSSDMFVKIAEINAQMRKIVLKGGTTFPKQSFMDAVVVSASKRGGIIDLQDQSIEDNGPIVQELYKNSVFTGALLELAAQRT